jgi:hypothetical protein
MADLSKALFSLNGEYPKLLPGRFRLPSGVTRYSCDVTLEEVTLCGYQGPVKTPEFDSQVEKLIWDSSSLTFSVGKLSPEDIKIAKDRKYRSLLEGELASIDSNYREKLTEQGQYKYDAYYGKILNLVSSDDLLDESSVPTKTFSALDTIEGRQEALDTFVDDFFITKMRFNYEYYGVKTWEMEHRSYIYDYLRTEFVVPTGWVPSGQLSPDQKKAWEDSPYFA